MLARVWFGFMEGKGTLVAVVVAAVVVIEVAFYSDVMLLCYLGNHIHIPLGVLY